MAPSHQDYVCKLIVMHRRCDAQPCRTCLDWNGESTALMISSLRLFARVTQQLLEVQQLLTTQSLSSCSPLPWQLTRGHLFSSKTIDKCLRMASKCAVIDLRERMCIRKQLISVWHLPTGVLLRQRMLLCSAPLSRAFWPLNVA